LSAVHERDSATLPWLSDFGLQRLEGLSEALALPPKERDAALALFRLVSSTWPEGPLSAAAPWETDLTDDGSPFEFSIGFERDQPELRLLFESQLPTASPTPRTSWQAGRELQQRLRAEGSCDTYGFDRIADMFEPPSGLPSRFSLWHAAVLRPGRGAMFKAYVNPEVRGVAASRELTRQALEALGVAPAWSFMERRLRDATRILYLSTDLEKPRDARIKVYQTATDASAVEELVRGSANTPPGLATSWLRGLTLGEGPYEARPILVCHSWRQRGTAPEATVHIPIRNYAPSDGEALERTLDLLPTRSGEQLAAALKVLAHGDLQRSRGTLAYVSLRAVDGHVRVTTYLSPGAYTLAEEGRGSGTIPRGRPSSPSRGP
jgi:hypothetical protein